MTTTKKACKDCGSLTRKVTAPGPRCATCHRDRKKAAKEAAWANHIFKTYGLTKEQYDALYAHHNGKCFICQRATGATKRLAVDHDHGTGFVRGLLCGPCNKVIGHFRDDPEALQRGAYYLRQPPAFRVIGKVKPDA